VVGVGVGGISLFQPTVSFAYSFVDSVMSLAGRTLESFSAIVSRGTKLLLGRALLRIRVDRDLFSRPGNLHLNLGGVKTYGAQAF
jgi:hypothetical protein